MKTVAENPVGIGPALVKNMITQWETEEENQRTNCSKTSTNLERENEEENPKIV